MMDPAFHRQPKTRDLRDQTGHELATTQLEILANASRVFSEAAIDPRTTFEAIARHVAEVLGDLCSIRLLSAEKTEFEPPLGLWDTDEGIRSVLADIPPEAAGGLSLGAEILRTGQAVVIPNLDPALVASLVPSERRELVEHLQVHSLMAVPLKAHGQLLGFMAVCRRRDGTAAPYTDSDLALVEELAVRVALVVNQWRTLRLAEQSLTELRAAIAIRDEFLSIASHELRTPLTALELQLDGLRRSIERNAGKTDTEKIARKLGLALRQADRLAGLVEGLLDVSRIQTGRFKLELQDIDLIALVKEVVERFDEAAHRTDVEIRTHLPPTCTGRWDRNRIDQALTNLLSNALKYGPGKPVDVRLDTSDERVMLSVRDEGIGIAPDDRDRIFGRFERAVSSQHYGGLGLGLYIAERIIREHGGSIEVESELGKGATFSIVLPVLTADRAIQKDAAS